MVLTREVREGRQSQGVDEELAYTILSTPWGSAPTSLSVKGYDITKPGQRLDVSSTILSGASAVNEDVMTTPTIKSLTHGHLYRIEVKFTCSSNVFECFFEIDAHF